MTDGQFNVLQSVCSRQHQVLFGHGVKIKHSSSEFEELGQVGLLFPVCQECVDLRFGVPGLCLGVPGKGSARRCKWLIYKPLEPPKAG
jgi:hypothetical protein